MVDVPGYDVLGVLGVGGQAVVYRARQRSVAGREVAVKVYDRSLLSERDRRRFEREVRASASLSGHRHVIHVYETGLLPGGQPYLSMELCPGGSLSTRLRERGPVPASEVAAIGAKIAGALATAHAAGVLHRDVKPGNLLFARDGEPVLTDFGIAAVVIPGAEQSATLGALTPAYAAPELFHGDEPSQAGDIYSLGATLYALLIGRPVRWPAGREPSLVELFRLHSDPLPDVPGAPPALLDALRRAMATDPGARFATAYEFAAALARVTGTPVDAPVALTPVIPAQPRSPSTLDSEATTSNLPDWKQLVDAAHPVGVSPTTRELISDLLVALALLGGLGVWGFATGGPAAGGALLVAALALLGLAAYGRFWGAVAAYGATLGSAFWVAGGPQWRQPVAWLVTAVAVGFAGVVVYDVRALRRFSVQALAQPRWTGRPEQRPLLVSLEHIPAARFFRLPSAFCDVAVAAGDQVALVRWTVWPARPYAVRGDHVEAGEYGWEPGSRELTEVRAEVTRHREWSGAAAFHGFLVVRGEDGQPVPIDGQPDGDVTVLPEGLAEPVIGAYLAARAYELNAPLIDHLSQATGGVPRAAVTSRGD